MLRSIKPTIDAGGKLILLSRSDKTQPEARSSRFTGERKRVQRRGSAFSFPGTVCPDRDLAWYERQKADILQRTGSLDDLHEQYPNSDAEALSPRSLDKRIPAVWLEKCLDEMKPLEVLVADSARHPC